MVVYRMDVKTEDLLKVGLCCKSIWLEIAFNSDPQFQQKIWTVQKYMIRNSIQF